MMKEGWIKITITGMTLDEKNNVTPILEISYDSRSFGPKVKIPVKAEEALVSPTIQVINGKLYGIAFARITSNENNEVWFNGYLIGSRIDDLVFMGTDVTAVFSEEKARELCLMENPAIELAVTTREMLEITQARADVDIIRLKSIVRQAVMDACADALRNIDTVMIPNLTQIQRDALLLNVG